MRQTKLVFALLFLIYGLVQFFQMGMFVGLKMANAANGIQIGIASRVLTHAVLFVCCIAAAFGLWQWSRKPRRHC